ncbi:MAG: N-6 DNA methylase [Alphaproteobacteria bacterium]|nr:N-6 DNA methylase [Alphaproteobacteria bacterium]
MLDKTTKTKIDTARDILVGKVPNPQSQVELITIAMIYKFMDDMDMQNIELGGNRVFFTDDLEQYAWSKVLSKNINNWERISLYAEALDKLQVAKQIPELFRKIFKGAFLPFRDGATLTLFLNEIDGFSYNNSENLGNAFEYLLSIMGSQGDAGQFRTPRHIIDFIVDVVNPQKTDTILDPACGTAGFLISAYKHIMEQAKETKKPLTPAQHQQLMQNIVGYDISPDMVKLASVNLFLHQFPEPKIYEYDTLSSEERWDDKFDVILANPPFMTPKGGIQPHSKFGVKANRAEVLFVDYFMEHLNLKGKAGFVVPEGIIFQSATAYKSLRKLMVEENYLYAVVSLPSGVFNPYAGVKTSILFFDRELAKQTKDILFVKVDKDGYDLGAQRRPIKDNDLPEAIELLKLWQKSITSGTTDEKISKSKRVTIVSKEKLAEDGEYNLSASRYQEAQDFSNCQYEMVKLGDVCEVYNGSTPSKSNEDYWNSRDIPWFTVDDIRNQGRVINRTQKFISTKALKETSVKLLPQHTVLICCTASVGEYAITNIELTTNQQFNGLVVKECAKNKLNPHFLFWYTTTFKNELKRLSGKTSFEFVSVKTLKTIEIPLPPMSVQEEIVKELDAYQAIIDGAQKVVDNWKPTFKINPNWEKVKIGDVCDVRDGTHDSPKPQQVGYPLVTSKSLVDGKIDFANTVFISKEDHINICKRSNVDDGDVLFAMIGTIGNPVVVKKDKEFSIKNVALFKVGNNNSKLNNCYLKYILEVSTQELNNKAIGGNQKFVGLGYLRNYEIPLPSLEEQKAIVAQIEQEEQYVEACKKLIELSKQKISNKIQSIWNCDNE